MTISYIKHVWFGGGRVIVNKAPDVLPAGWKIGVNIHSGGGDASANTTWATQLSYRGMKVNRVDLFGGDHTLLRDQITKIRANGGSVQAVLFPVGYDVYTDRTNYSAAYVEGYGNITNGTRDLVNSMSDIVTDFELLNEVVNRPEIQAVVARNSAQGNINAYIGVTACEGMAAYLHGMSDAVRSVASATGRTLRIINGLNTRDYAWLDFLTLRGVQTDVVGFHWYPNNANASFTTDTWWYPTGPAGMVARFGKPVTINEYNADEIYNTLYQNSAGDALTEQGFQSIAKHIKEIVYAPNLNLDSIVFYEWVDRPAQVVPENRFGLNYNVSTAKTAQLIATAYAGGTMTQAERDTLTSKNLMTITEINNFGGTIVAAPAPAPTPPSSYAFGQKPGALQYTTGVFQTYETDAAATTRLQAKYNNWKANRIFPHPTLANAYYNRFTQYPTYPCVSEGQGYAMLMTVLFGGYDANAQTIFDGLLKLARTYYAYNRVNATYGTAGYYLMDWRLQTANVTAGDGYDAPDGDLDIALSLLMAYRQWGNTSPLGYNYLQEAINTIQAIYTVRHYSSAYGGHLSAVQDSNTVRSSDMMLQHFRDFARADTAHAQFWGTDIISNYYRIINYVQQTYSPSAGMMPDFIINCNTATPAPTNGAAGTTDPGSTTGGDYAYNACRNPWRMGIDVYFNNDPNWRSALTKLIDYFYNRYVNAGGGVNGVMVAIDSVVAMNGTQLGSGDDPSFINPIMVGAASLGSYRPYQQFVNDMWAWSVLHDYSASYYGGELQTMGMAIVSKNWWRPMV